VPQTRPSAVVLRCRVDRSSELQSSPQNEVRVSHELPPEEDHICLALLQVVVRLFPVKDQPDRADLDFWMRLLDTVRQGNL